MNAGRIAAAVFAVILGLVAMGMIVGGIVLTWAHTTQRDADGFLTSPEFALESDGYAVTSEDIDLASRPGDWWPSGLADVRFEVSSDTPVFIGIAPSPKIVGYLDGVPHDQVTRLGPAASDVDYRTIAGDREPSEPPPTGDTTMWVAQDVGTEAEITWDVDQGEWTVVLMNADGSAGVEADVVAGAKISILLAIGIGILAVGVVLGAIAAALLVWAVMARGREAAPAVAPERLGTGFGPYPVVVEGRIDEGLTRWMWLVKWFLAIPHYVVLAFLWAAFVLLTIIAWFAILFTGRYPRSIFDFNVGVLRWSWRVGFYTFSVAATDRYPPFTLTETDYPTRFDVAYPERLSRGLVLVKWILAIPHFLIVAVFTSGLIWWGTDFGDGDTFLDFGGGLVGLLVFIAVVILLFTGAYPPRLFDLIVGLNRWGYRVGAYAALMTDDYPPFRLDLGGTEPPPESG